MAGLPAVFAALLVALSVPPPIDTLPAIAPEAESAIVPLLRVVPPL
jgi:hypothetical protein